MTVNGRPAGCMGQMGSRQRLLGCFGLLALFILGFGARIGVCASCEGQGPGSLTWYGIRLYSYPHPDWLFDEFGTVSLWERLYGRPCPHDWHFTTYLLLIVPLEHGSPLKSRFHYGQYPAGLRLLAREDKDWARRTWEAIRRMPPAAQADPLSRLGELGSAGLGEEYLQKPVPRVDVVAWWNRNQDWIAGPGAKPK